MADEDEEKKEAGTDENPNEATDLQRDEVEGAKNQNETTDSQEEEMEIDEDLADALGAVDSAEEIDIDEALAEVDPGFGEELGEISNDDFAGVVINSEEASEEVDEAADVPSAYKALWNNLPDETKKRYYLAGGLVAVLIPFAVLVYMGKVLPTFELPYNMTMQEFSKKVYSYPTDGVQVPLFDDFRTQSHTIQFPKTVINLRSVEGQPSYGEFQFSLVLRDEEMSVAIQTKQSEIIDLMQRVLEQVSWKELQSPIGKEKVKKVIRHRINEYLQGNVVLGVYYRHVILEK